ncbi:MAG: 50S ribosomal protein L9 [Actinobacteria bacterium]|jgi:large subunit ribosomal protein L9|nr:50S ribosomal protein L9 [Actinomycetota bacterium]MBU1492604.1 50S ribosomal protein L9 [Actinomycetota bacterium]
MKVILTKDVPGVGHKGDAIEVADGFGRNYLVPRSLAVKATRGAMKQAEGLQRSRQEAVRKAKVAAQAIIDPLAGQRVVVAARAADEGKLFGSIGVKDIAAAIQKFTGIAVDATYIKLANPIKEIGLHEIVVRPHPEVEATLTLDVIPA